MSVAEIEECKMASVNAMLDKMSAMLFELAEIDRIQALRTNLTPDEKTELSQDAFDLGEKIFSYLKVYAYIRSLYNERGEPFDFDTSIFDMAFAEHERASELLKSRARRIVIE